MMMDNAAIKEHVINKLPRGVLSTESRRVVSFINKACKKTTFGPSDESMVVFGGAAVALYCADPQIRPRTTKDVDIRPYKGDAIDIEFESEEENKYFDLAGNGLLLVEPDWSERLICASNFIDASWASNVFLFNPYDIVVAKLARFSSSDIEDCEALIKMYELSAEIAELIMREAIRYYPAQSEYRLREWRHNFEDIFNCEVATPFES